MVAIADPRTLTQQRIYEWYERNADDGHRPHLGASLIGHACERHLWLTFRWARRSNFPGRVLRLFDTGKREEARIVDDLRGIGCEVFDTQPDGSQWRIETFGGHFSGSLDGAVRGVPEAPLTWHVLEAKTHNAKSFADLSKKGVEVSKPMHYAQMQVYMGFTGMERALYFAVCKDTDEIYTERVHFDREKFQRLVNKAEAVIFANEPPPRISSDPAWFECKFCDHHALCHGTTVAEPNCRSCAHVTPARDGTWQCERHGSALSDAEQRNGCQAHRYIPILLERIGTMVDASQEDNWVRYRNIKTAGYFTNGVPPAGFSSEEIHAAAEPAILDDNDHDLQALRRDFDARVVA